MNDYAQKGFSLMSYVTNALAGVFGLISLNVWIFIVSVFFSALTYFCNHYYQKRRERRDLEFKLKEDARAAELHALDVKLKQAKLKQLGE
ncbi:phage holin family protein [Shewanella sp. C32]|uniref:Phage holin family protein n=1 Tax=Shewanella electrica TaxID=515560 RepID=A0ABT2FQC6_9GAMM|nr:HP1 family phage holin [Shewanella electrica]MCH1926878.1 phage holin family protein [Shewanella electrica]MCS4558532.1 phage holin family protein [Shewanella electrica]